MIDVQGGQQESRCLRWPIFLGIPSLKSSMPPNGAEARVRARGAVRCDGSVLRKQRGLEHGFFEGPDAARCTLTSLVEAGPSWLRSIAPVVDDPELRDQGRCGSQQSSVALGMTLFVKRKEYNWQTCEDP
jgi:hypothetical protein